MSDFNQIPHVCGFWALSCSNLNYVLTLSFTYLNEIGHFQESQAPSWLRALRMNLHCHIRQNSAKMRHPTGLLFIDCIFNYFHFASSPSREEIKTNINHTILVLGIKKNSNKHLITGLCLQEKQILSQYTHCDVFESVK